MKKLLIAAVLAFSVSGCATTGGGLPTQADIDKAIAQVQALTRTACGFVPIAATIIGIFDSGLGSVIDVAHEICNAVAGSAMAADLKLAPKTPVTVTVRGVQVKGYFVNKGAPKRK